jgi:hypothetical protein
VVEREIRCVLGKGSEEQTEGNVVFGVDNGTGIEARYVEDIAQQLSEILRLELSVHPTTCMLLFCTSQSLLAAVTSAD